MGEGKAATVARAVVTAQGGVVRFDGGGRVEIPAGALQRDTTIVRIPLPSGLSGTLFVSANAAIKVIDAKVADDAAAVTARGFGAEMIGEQSGLALAPAGLSVGVFPQAKPVVRK